MQQSWRRLRAASGRSQRQELLPYICRCPAGVYGLNCESLGTAPVVILPTCLSLLTADPLWCKNGGTCMDASTNPVCACPCGFGGDQCEVAASAASRVPGNLLDFCSQGDVCHNGGTCFNAGQGQSFFCNCAAGWWGTRCQNQGKSAGTLALPSLLMTVLAIVVAIKARF